MTTQQTSPRAALHTTSTALFARPLHWLGGLTCALLLGVPSSQADAQGGSWTSEAALPTPRSGAPAGVINGLLYVVSGGGGNSGWPYPRLTSVQVFDPSANTWTTRAPIPLGVLLAASGVINGQLYVAGGSAAANQGNVVANLQVYDPATDVWTSKQPLPAPRAGSGGGVIDGKLYVVGGTDGANGLPATLERYSPASDSWETLSSPLPTPRTDPAVGVVDGRLYVLGGNQTSGATLSVVEAYNPKTGTWATRAPMPTPRTGLTVQVINGILYAIGGISNASGGPGTTLNVVEAYNPATDSWTTENPMLTARSLPSAGVLGYSIYVVGGENDDVSPTPHVGNNEVFTPSGILSLGMYAGLTLGGPVGSTNRIEFRNDLTSTNWTVLTDVVLTSSPYLFIDPTSGPFPHRFYRVVIP